MPRNKPNKRYCLRLLWTSKIRQNHKDNNALQLISTSLLLESKSQFVKEDQRPQSGQDNCENKEKGRTHSVG